MAFVINTNIRIKVEDLFGEVWDSDKEDVRLEIDIDLEKDISLEPNQSNINIYNLNESIVNFLSSGTFPTIEVFYNIYGKTDFIRCFLGNIEEPVYTEEHPGCRLNLICESQRTQSTGKYIDKTYPAGTAVSLIIDDLIYEIGLPVESVDIPDLSTIRSLTLSGPALLVLHKTLTQKDLNLFCYINDGVLYISSIYEPPSPTIIKITKNILVSEPIISTRRDVTSLWFSNATESAANEAAKAFDPNPDKAKKNAKVGELDKDHKIVTVDMVRSDIPFIQVEMLGLPNLQLDSIIQIEGYDALYRTKTVGHHGNNKDGVITSIRADLYQGIQGI
jgi:hypothetical protein